MPSTLRFSARILHQPTRCCCCHGPGATGRWVARYTRRTGKRVVRTASKSWSFALCARCETWIGEEDKAKRARSAANVARVACILACAVGGSWVAMAPLMLCMVPVVLVAPARPAAAGPPGEPPAKQGGAPKPKEVDPAVAKPMAACLLGVSAPASVVLGLGVIYGGRKWHLSASRWAVAATARADGVRPRTACGTQPVEYHGWDGTIHTFTFESDDFAEAFRRLNAAKQVR